MVGVTTIGEIVTSLGERTVSHTFTVAFFRLVLIIYSLPVASALIEYTLVQGSRDTSRGTTRGYGQVLQARSGRSRRGLVTDPRGKS